MVLGGQNPRFSHFFRCFFEVVFAARLGRAKNRPMRPNKTQKAQIQWRIPVVPPPPGERKREGIKSLGLHQELALSDSPFEIGLGEFENDLVCGPARPAHLKVGGGL